MPITDKQHQGFIDQAKQDRKLNTKEAIKQADLIIDGQANTARAQIASLGQTAISNNAAIALAQIGAKNLMSGLAKNRNIKTSLLLELLIKERGTMGTIAGLIFFFHQESRQCVDRATAAKEAAEMTKELNAADCYYWLAEELTELVDGYQQLRHPASKVYTEAQQRLAELIDKQEQLEPHIVRLLNSHFEQLS